VFESGAILTFAENPGSSRRPMFAAARPSWSGCSARWAASRRNHQFGIYAPEKIPYAIGRYVNDADCPHGLAAAMEAER